MNMDNLGGRPPVFETPSQFESKVEGYFESIKESKEPCTITGLCLFLGFESRQSFYDYEQKDGFSYIVKRARLMVESNYEQRLDRQSPTGAIFALKNMGWKDTQEIKHEVTGFMNVDPLADDPADNSTPQTSTT